MPKKFHKLFLDSSIAFRDLSFFARQIYAGLHQQDVDDDGTVACLKPNEEPHQAIARAGGVPVRDRRLHRKLVRELVEKGFLVVRGDKVVLVNWTERQAWCRGELPLPHEDTNTTATRPEHDRDTTATRPRHDPSTTATRHRDGAKEPESFKADSESTPSQRGSGYGSGSGSGLREGRNKTARGEQLDDEASESELDPPSENGRAETLRESRPRVAAAAEPPPARSAAPQGSEQWCREELDSFNPFDVELFEKGAR